MSMKFHCQLAPISRSACSRLVDRGVADGIEGWMGGRSRARFHRL